MAKSWKPQITVDGKTTIARNYKEIKRTMQSLLDDSENGIVSVLRSRRGEWGEWFEKWGLLNNKPVILKQGWM